MYNIDTIYIIDSHILTYSNLISHVQVQLIITNMIDLTIDKLQLIENYIKLFVKYNAEIKYVKFITNMNACFDMSNIGLLSNIVAKINDYLIFQKQILTMQNITSIDKYLLNDVFNNLINYKYEIINISKQNKVQTLLEIIDIFIRSVFEQRFDDRARLITDRDNITKLLHESTNYNTSTKCNYFIIREDVDSLFKSFIQNQYSLTFQYILSYVIRIFRSPIINNIQNNQNQITNILTKLLLECGESNISFDKIINYLNATNDQNKFKFLTETHNLLLNKETSFIDNYSNTIIFKPINEFVFNYKNKVYSGTSAYLFTIKTNINWEPYNLFNKYMLVTNFNIVMSDIDVFNILCLPDISTTVYTLEIDPIIPLENEKNINIHMFDYDKHFANTHNTTYIKINKLFLKTNTSYDKHYMNHLIFEFNVKICIENTTHNQQNMMIQTDTLNTFGTSASNNKFFKIYKMYSPIKDCNYVLTINKNVVLKGLLSINTFNTSNLNNDLNIVFFTKLDKIAQTTPTQLNQLQYYKAKKTYKIKGINELSNCYECIITSTYYNINWLNENITNYGQCLELLEYEYLISQTDDLDMINVTFYF